MINKQARHHVKQFLICVNVELSLRIISVEHSKVNFYFSLTATNIPPKQWWSKVIPTGNPAGIKSTSILMVCFQDEIIDSVWFGHEVWYIDLAQTKNTFQCVHMTIFDLDDLRFQAAGPWSLHPAYVCLTGSEMSLVRTSVARNANSSSVSFVCT